MSSVKGAKGPVRRGPEELPIMADQMEQKMEDEMDTVGVMDCRIAKILTNIISRSFARYVFMPLHVSTGEFSQLAKYWSTISGFLIALLRLSAAVLDPEP